jgi:hypothetical protein
VAPEFSDSGPLGTSGRDVDPRGTTRGLADVSFRSKNGGGGLSPLNGAALAVLADGAAPTADICRTATGCSSKIVAMPIDVATVRCLRTSDGRYGSLSVTQAETSALGGTASITWTVWL